MFRHRSLKDVSSTNNSDYHNSTQPVQNGKYENLSHPLVNITDLNYQAQPNITVKAQTRTSAPPPLERLVHLAAKIKTASAGSQSYEESLTINSAYYKVFDRLSVILHRSNV